MPGSAPPSTLTVALDVVDKLIKLLAVIIGGLWAWWNYHKSRTYEQRLELEVLGTVFTRGDLYGDVQVIVKNIGGTHHNVQHRGTYCKVSYLDDRLVERTIDLFPAFALHRRSSRESRLAIHFAGLFHSLMTTFFGSNSPCV